MTLKSNPTVLAVGQPDFLRFVILADDSVPVEQRRYWTGENWIDNLRDARLYAQPSVAWHEKERINAEQSDP